MGSKLDRPEAIIFDFDGTLTDTMPLHIEAWIALLHDNGLDITVDDYWASGVAGRADDAVMHFLGKGMGREQAAILADQKEFLYRVIARGRLTPVKSAIEFLTRLREQGYRLGMATSSGARNVAFQLAELDMARFFEVVVTADEVKHGKPAPDIFLLTAQKLGVDPARCVAFEDSRPGIASAHRAGMPVIAVSTAHPASELADRPGVEFVIEDFDDERLGLFQP
ncbi:MAG: HAD family phosphatase [Capsulimonadaceae bacterium]|nr:HAD family phosphatase [Capsulimonadaceae bacterium]